MSKFTKLFGCCGAALLLAVSSPTAWAPAAPTLPSATPELKLALDTESLQLFLQQIAAEAAAATEQA